MKVFTSETQKIGEIGEQIACKYLQNKGFKLFDRNFTQKSGEIDIVAEKDDKLHFFEVKSISRENTGQVSREMFRPEENMTYAKMKKLSRVTQIFFSRHREFRDMDFYWNVILVEMDPKTRMAKVKMLEKVNITE